MTVLLFAGPDYEPSGGWNDLEGEYTDADEARATTASWRRTRRELARREWISGAPILWASTNSTYSPPPPLAVGQAFGRGTIVDGPDSGGRWLVDYPARTDHYYDHDWAHIVADGEIVAEWTPDKGWVDA